MNTNLTRTAAAFIAIGTLALAGCSNNTETTSSGATTASGDAGTSDGYTVGLVMIHGDEYFHNIELGLTEAVKTDGGKVVAVNSNNDPGTEAQVVQNLIQSDVDAILIQPVAADSSIATMRQVKDAGIALVCYGNCTDAATSPDLVDGVVQSDNTALGVQTGELAAQYIKDEMGGKAKIGILNCDTAAETCKLRKAGFIETIEAEGLDVEFVADQEGYLADKATTTGTNMLSSNADINLVWASNEGGTVGLVTAVGQSGREIAVFGTDMTEQLAGFVKNGALKAATGQDPQGTAAKAYELAKNAIAGMQNDPFEILIPGITYDSKDLTTIDQYLASKK
ncbi:substrate-binding domain-containing protein [Schaalia vaccimaxillae]|uniref:substrate-binding domain-containing protein n=1 Tax=Schaalia vaccimaxillae TaxID=183916 RepID=UPI0003B47602|nr:substrate-binding domain-containing protein [Schaalia vaccimaxillae]